MVNIKLHFDYTYADMRPLKCSHLLHNKNAFQGDKTNTLLALKAKITAIIVRVAGSFYF